MADSNHTTAILRLLESAIRSLQGEQQLADFLGVSRDDVLKWQAGTKIPPGHFWHLVQLVRERDTAKR